MHLIFSICAVLYSIVYIVSNQRNCWFGYFFFFYNVFRATRYKTTSLPAALNQARGIDTLLRNCIVMHCINRSRIYWRPSLFNVLCHRRGQITNTNKFTSIIQTFSLSWSVALRNIWRFICASAPLFCATEGADGVYIC